MLSAYLIDDIRLNWHQIRAKLVALNLKM